ncbi:MAG: hypothetical protein KA004_04195 [Verrucomicrobiales bacterium]|nr:hypothetical protein [Verrucomicrobiales bacterium]
MWNYIRFYFTNYTPQIIFFLVFMAAAVPILIYYRRRNPNPRFRPSLGEMTMVSLFAVVICGVMGVGLGTIFNKEQDLRRLGDKPVAEFNNYDAGISGRNGGGGEEGKAKKEQGPPVELLLQGGGK